MKNFRIDRVIPEVGRIGVSSGTDDPKMSSHLNLMVDDLKKSLKKDQDRLPDWVAHRDGEIAPHALYDLGRAGLSVAGEGGRWCPLNDTWAMDFMRDTLYDGRKYHIFNVLDKGNRKCLAIEAATSLPGVRVTAVVDQLVALHGAPQHVRCDNGPEFIAEARREWCAGHGIQFQFIQPGSRIRARTSNVSIGPIAPKSSTRESSRH